jgi:FkbH-like protein
MGDNGMISVLICKKAADIWTIDTWLMSCRVLGRKVEEAVLQDLVRAAQSAGASRLIGNYYPTSRNAIVKDHYKKLGFLKTHATDQEGTWTLNIGEYKEQTLPMKFFIAN